MSIDYKKVLNKILKKNGTSVRKQLEYMVNSVDILDNQRLNGDKRPKQKTNHVGIEIECFGYISPSALYILLLDHQLDDYIQIGEDGSIDHHSGDSYELRVLVPEKKLGKILPRIGKFLKAAKLKTNMTCGLHVHLDMRNRNFKRCHTNLIKMQNVLFSLVDSDRWNNTYCKFTTTQNSHERYLAINSRSYTDLKTIEIRLHQGTVDMLKVQKWIDLLLTIVNAKTIKEVKEVKTEADAVVWFKSHKKLNSYIKKNFNPSWFSRGNNGVYEPAYGADEDFSW